MKPQSQRQHVFIIPGEVGVVAQGGAVRLQPQRTLTAAMRRGIIQRYLSNREAYPSVRAFATAESQRLRQHGYLYPVGTIAVLIQRGLQKPPRIMQWEKLLHVLRHKNPRTKTFWFDIGDMSTAAHLRTAGQCSILIARLREKGYEIRRCRTSPADEIERGWQWQYRLWEAGGA